MDNDKFEEQKTRALKTLAIMLDYLGLDATLSGSERNGKLAIAISSSDAGRIIGRKGQTLDSLQLILNRILFKGEEEFPRLELNIDGYPSNGGVRRERRDENDDSEGGREGDGRRRRNHDEPSISEEQLERQALDAAKEVKRWGEAVTLPAMNARDRRIIHVTLQEDPELTTESIGEGAMKKVVVSLKKD